MDKNAVLKALKELKEGSKERKFNQSVDLIINLKGLNLKRPENQIDLFASLPHSNGKKVKVCGLVGLELKEDATNTFDTTVSINDFEKYSDKHLAKKLANGHDFFVAQANVMPKVAQTFGKVLGTRGKMPNPKAGCVVAPKSNLAQVYEKLQHTMRVKAKVEQAVKLTIGNLQSKEEDIADNAMAIYNVVLHALPGEQNNIKNVLLKLTMSKPVHVE